MHLLNCKKSVNYGYLKKIRKVMKIKYALLIVITLLFVNKTFSQEMDIKTKVERYKPVTLSADLSYLTESEKAVFRLLVDVAKIMDDLYWMQNYGDKDTLLNKLTNEYEKKYVIINYGPWDDLDGLKPFIKGVGQKPAGANFYPADMTKEEFEKFSAPEKNSPYSIIRRDKNGNLVNIMYSQAFKEKLDEAAILLRKAADISEDKDFAKYLRLRADALQTDKYKESDIAWMDVKNSNLDFVVGPIENYTDGLFGCKTAFESYLLVKDLEWTKRLTKYIALLPELQKGLPVEDKYKSEVPGSGSDLNVYDALYYAGDCNAGSKTIAINLPNDEEVQLLKGSRRLQLKNIMKAKFDNIVKPIAELLISPEQRKYVKFDPFFENTTFHEVAHGLGIKNTINGKGTVREALKEQYSGIEEGKADILGLYIVTKLYESGELSTGELMDNYVTFLAGIFRSSRFGVASAHGKANIMRFYFFEKMGAFIRHDDGTYSVNFDKMKEAVTASVQQILVLQGDGDYNLAKKLIETDGVIGAELQKDLDRINMANIPVDIVFNMGTEYIKF
jgi:hypothetical protein